MATPPQPPPPPLNFWTALSESRRIIHAHSRHFLALSVLFLLPLSFSVVVYPTIQQQLLNPVKQPNSKTSLSFTHTYSSPLLSTHQHQQPFVFPIKRLVFVLLYLVFTLVCSLFAVGSITYSVYHGFYGRPVKLISAVRSAVISFLPLLATNVICQIILCGIIIAFGLVLILAVKGPEFMGFEVTYSYPYVIALCVAVLLVFVLVTVYLQVNWTLVYVVVVAESTWGFEPLKRSKALIKGMRIVALSSSLFFGVFGLILYWTCMVWGTKMGGGGGGDEGWKNWAFVVQIVLTSTCFVLLMLYNLAVNTVLYMYCKAIHGELAMEIAEEFAREYVSLPFDDGKIPHVVSVAYN